MAPREFTLGASACLDRTDEGADTTNAYRWHALAVVALSGQRRFVPRASTTVNYKIAPLGARNGGATRK
jgi:hypothetical protein